MKVKILIAAAITAVMVLVPVTSASAQSSTQWYWSAKAAAKSYVQHGLVEADGSFTPISYAACEGKGKRYDGLFKRFTCYIESPRWDPFYIDVYVTGKNTTTYDFLGFA